MIDGSFWELNIGETLSPAEVSAITLSLRVAFWGVISSLPLAIGVAWLLSRRTFLGHTILDGLIHLPLILPPVVTGYALLLLFGRRGLIGAWLAENFGIVFAFRWTGAALAAAVMGFPLMVQAIRSAFDAVDEKLEATARTLGASGPWVFLTITLPLILPGVLTGCVLAYAKSLGEFGATMTFVSNIPGETQTLPLAIYGMLQTPDGEAAVWRLSLISIALAMLALSVSGPAARALQRRLRGRDRENHRQLRVNKQKEN
ncbi:molybdate ABC transporter membrane subunit [Azospirillaceae bacterium]